jgi:hypothetical protein
MDAGDPSQFKAQNDGQGQEWNHSIDNRRPLPVKAFLLAATVIGNNRIRMFPASAPPCYPMQKGTTG